MTFNWKSQIINEAAMKESLLLAVRSRYTCHYCRLLFMFHRLKFLLIDRRQYIARRVEDYGSECEVWDSAVWTESSYRLFMALMNTTRRFMDVVRIVTAARRACLNRSINGTRSMPGYYTATCSLKTEVSDDRFVNSRSRPTWVFRSVEETANILYWRALGGFEPPPCRPSVFRFTSESKCKCLTCNQKPTGSQFSLLHEPN